MAGDETSGALAPVESEFDEIKAAVMETERGRWFLSEYARRNRHADTERLLEAIERLENNLGAAPQPAATDSSPAEVAGLKRAICEMADEIAAAKREIAAIKSPEGEPCEIAGATAELDAIVEAAETATSEILEAAEQIQEVAWTLREAGAEDPYCDALDQRATEIYTACSFQDITGQRTTKVVRVLQKLETRINTIVELWGGAIDSAQAGDPGAGAEKDDAHLLNGPALHGEGVDQDDVDRMMDEFWADDGADTDANPDAAIDLPVTEVSGTDIDEMIEADFGADPEAEMAAEEATDSAETLDDEADEFAAADPGDESEATKDAAQAAVGDEEDEMPDATASADDGDAFAKLSQKDYDAMFG